LMFFVQLRIAISKICCPQIREHYLEKSADSISEQMLIRLNNLMIIKRRN